MKTSFENRILLSLSNDSTSEILRSVLRSPLGLATEVIKMLFENDFDKIKDELDSIKQFVAGIVRAEKLSKDYVVANYYPYLFSFTQYFHSSYRARQGKTLEEFVKEIIRQSNSSFVVAKKKDQEKEVMNKIFERYTSKLDLDVVAEKSEGDILIVQLRSRDDTGGTTAKSSLVEALRESLSLKTKQNAKLLYLVSIWDKVHSNQKKITIKKLYMSLKPYINLRLTEKHFLENIEQGIKINDVITLKMSYGADKLVTSINDWMGQQATLSNNDLKRMIALLEEWDDLWLAYTVACIELENIKLHNNNNIEYLDELLDKFKYNLSELRTHAQFINLANELAIKIIPLWKKDTINLSSMSERAHYIRDLILLRFIYELSNT